MVFQETYGCERRTEHHTWTQLGGLRQRLVLPNDAQPRQGRYHVHPIFPGRLAHVGDQSLVDLERDAFLQLPPQHRKRVLRGAGKLIEVLDKNSDDRVGQNQRNILTSAVEPVAGAGNRRFQRRRIQDVGLHRRGEQRRGR